MNEEFFATVYNKALDIVSRREHSEKEIKNKLLEKFDAPEIIEQVVLKLIENNLINDVIYQTFITPNKTCVKSIFSVFSKILLVIF